MQDVNQFNAEGWGGFLQRSCTEVNILCAQCTGMLKEGPPGVHREAVEDINIR